jgi:hypothetical protein
MEYEHSPDMGNMPDMNRNMDRGMPRTQTPGTQSPGMQSPGTRMPNGTMPDNQMQENDMSNVDRMENDTVLPMHLSLAMAYVPYQPFENFFDNETALRRGTLFKALDLPFLGGNGGRK